MKNFWIVFILVYIQTIQSNSYEFDISFDPPLIRGLKQWETKNITFNVSLSESDISEPIEHEFELILTAVISPQSPRKVVKIVGNNRYVFRITNTEPIFSSNFQIEGLFLGYSNITFEILNNKTLVQTLDTYSVSVIRKTSIFDALFGIILISMVTVNYVNMGCHLDLDIVIQTLKKPIGPIIGFVCQFTVMPLTSYFIGWLLLDDISLRLGLFTLGCSPGGNSSNFWTLLFNGDMNLSITMTFISTIGALVMMPIWLFTLGRSLFLSRSIQIPYLNLFTSLITLTFPMVIGIAIQHYKPNWAKVSHKIIKPFTIVVIIIGIIGSSILYNHIFILFTWPIVLSGFMVAGIAYSIGALASGLCGLKRAQIIAISIETAYQNGGIAFILLFLSLPQPDADLASVPCVSQLLITGQPLWLVFLGIKAFNYYNSKNVKNNSIEEKIEKTKEQTNRNGLENASFDGPYDPKQQTDGNINHVNKSNDKQVTKF